MNIKTIKYNWKINSKLIKKLEIEKKLLFITDIKPMKHICNV